MKEKLYKEEHQITAILIGVDILFLWMLHLLSNTTGV